ncbi:MAG: type III-B CRISPR module RAMP protein Cmr6 [Cyanothece sp. SIO1E1]|nr:type III-B CRISPR module RAMP protein Cmr6 [Cyanothece sp. SIO1E1]
MVFERPKRPGQTKSIPARQRPNSSTQRPARRNTAGNGGQRNGGQRGNGGGDEPSPWLQHPSDPEPNPDPTASFIEYLRWMRSPDHDYKDPTKVQILQLAEDNANYRDRLTTLTDRTQLIAGRDNCFQARCLWRIRVGGHRGPESILLPAFDALGMPYIPSSTLRGVARTQAIRELMSRENDLSWEAAEERVADCFGSLKQEGANRSGKVVFLDAYPLPQQSGAGGGLTVDMANNIWSWDAAGQNLIYSPNPNPFFSLSEATFFVGIRPTPSCNQETLAKVKRWLVKGLQAGIGSQVNTGYGSLVRAGTSATSDSFFEVEFTLEGQLIHGRQKFTQWNWNDRRNEWQMRGQTDAEVRPVAFKSMLRYWLRAFALGVLPIHDVQALEAQLFGAISPKQARGWITVWLSDGRLVQREARLDHQGKQDPCGVQTGRLILSHSSESPDEQKQAIRDLLRSLTWMMFHLGGLGQGARRPCYSRRSRNRAPWWRGSTLIPESDDAFWNLPDTPQEFQRLFQQRLQRFYAALQEIADGPLTPEKPRVAGQVRQDQWVEAVDKNCQIVVCAGREDFGKPYALATLHSSELKVPDRQGQPDYDGNLCGQVQGHVKPSPVWIADMGDYQITTVFGATQDPRRRYLQSLKRNATRSNYALLWPLA